MDDEITGGKPLSLGLTLIGLAASLAAIMTSGGLAIAAGIIGLACLGGSLAASFLPLESPCERYWRECDEAPAATAEPVAGQEQELGHGHHWRQKVAASRCGTRRR